CVVNARQDPVSGPCAGALDEDPHSQAVCFDETQATSPGNYSNPKPGDPSHPMPAHGRPPSVAFIAPRQTRNSQSSNQVGIKPGASVHDALSTDGPGAVAFQEAQSGVRENDEAGSLRANGPGHDPVGTRVREGMSVRRLTPRECERLQ